MMNVSFLTDLAAVCGVCVVGVNIVVEVLKTFWLKKETSRPIAVLLVSEVMCFLLMCVYCERGNVVFEPMMAAGTVVGGFFVAYGAMFGYDKLYGEIVESVKKIVRKDDGDDNERKAD